MIPRQLLVAAALKFRCVRLPPPYPRGVTKIARGRSGKERESEREKGGKTQVGGGSSSGCGGGSGRGGREGGRRVAGTEDRE